MDKAKAAVSDFIAKAGHHDTEVHERVAPSVEHKTVNPHQRDERQIAADREVHQDHYHTTVQPVHDREVLPEQHHHNIVPVEHRTHDKRDTRETESRIRQEKAQFKDEHVRTQTQHTSQTMPVVTGEHTHHHIHETIQPVVHKETIEPHVMHTTVPIHEVHHNKAQHHAASALPAMSMDQFTKGGGSLTGREDRVDHFKGVPQNLEKSLGSSGASGLRDSGFSTGSGTSGIGHGSTTGAAGAGLAAGAAAGSHHNDHSRSGLTGTQGLGSTSSAGVTPHSLHEGRGQTNSGLPGQRGAVSGMTGSPSDTTGATGRNLTGHHGTSSTTGHTGANAAAGAATAAAAGTGTNSGAGYTRSSLLDDHGLSTNTGSSRHTGMADKTLRSGTGTGGGMTGSDNMPGEFGEFSHRHDKTHPSSVQQGLGSSVVGVGTSSTTTAGKPSLMDKLNPKKDSDGDGKAGFLS